MRRETGGEGQRCEFVDLPSVDVDVHRMTAVARRLLGTAGTDVEPEQEGAARHEDAMDLTQSLGDEHEQAASRGAIVLRDAGAPVRGMAQDGHMPDAAQPIGDAFLSGGPEHRDVVLVPYDPSWPARYEAQQQRFRTVLGVTARRVEHIGSTAVPGLLAKPILDVMIVVNDVEDEAAYVVPLEGAGYVLRVRKPGHRMLHTPTLACTCTSGPKVLPPWMRTWSSGTGLRESGEDRDRYASTKRELAARVWPTMNHYADAKTGVIRQILNRPNAQPAPLDLSR